MAAGKSKLGKQLAKKLSREFVDLDQRIEERVGKTIPDLFADEGEEYFRKLESDLLHEIKANDQYVIALGGGTPCNQSNLQHIKESGISIYLQVEAAVLIGRLRQKMGERPLVSGLDDDGISDFVNQLLGKREQYYLKADHCIQSNNPKVSDILKVLDIS